MIYKGQNETVTIYKGSRIVAEIRKGIKLVWQAIRSCFGRGMWVNAKPYNNTDGWKNNL